MLHANGSERPALGDHVVRIHHAGAQAQTELPPDPLLLVIRLHVAAVHQDVLAGDIARVF
jgi:hypothetical protein